MIPVSDAYKELIKSNIRPKCEPIIKVSGTDENGEDVEIIWRAKNIKDLTYKSGNDPLGRELPYMELSWTEIYEGEFDGENFPEKYNNVAKYMPVELSFVQGLGFYNTWKTIFNGGKSWKDLFSSNTSWKQLKNQVLQETIKMPKLFLSASPSIKGKTITWTARDFLSFCDLPIKKCVSFGDGKFIRPLEIGAKETYSRSASSYLFSASQKTLDNFQSKIGPETRPYKMKVDMTYSDFFLNYLKLGNYILNFNFDGSVCCDKYENLLKNEICEYIKNKTMYSRPDLKKEKTMSSYVFYRNKMVLQESKKYSVKSSGKNGEQGIFLFEDYGTAQIGDNMFIVSSLDEDEDGLKAYAILTSGDTIVVTPWAFIGEEKEISVAANGESFSEKNIVNSVEYENPTVLENTRQRINYLKSFLSDENYILSVETLPSLMIEPLDVVNIDRNLSNDEKDEQKKSIVMSVEIFYNGSIKQKITAHEITTS